jgi:hypothetical protein
LSECVRAGRTLCMFLAVPGWEGRAAGESRLASLAARPAGSNDELAAARRRLLH